MLSTQIPLYSELSITHLKFTSPIIDRSWHNFHVKGLDLLMRHSITPLVFGAIDVYKAVVFYWLFVFVLVINMSLF